MSEPSIFGRKFVRTKTGYRYIHKRSGVCVYLTRITKTQWTFQARIDETGWLNCDRICPDAATSAHDAELVLLRLIRRMLSLIPKGKR
jgi:hypothetical protein